MKENIGPREQKIRAVAGPLMLIAGYVFGGRNGRAAGVSTMVAGAIVTATAVTRRCPLNELLGIDTSRPPHPGAWAGEPADRTWLDLDYSHFVNAASSLSFIKDKETAEAAVKAVLGILASRLEEPQAMWLTTRLPDPLSYESLRGHQVNVTDLSVDQYYGSLARQFHLTPDQAQVLAVTILRLVKEALEADGVREIERSLPRDWTELIERL